MDPGGLNLTPIGFGAFKIGRNQGIKYPSGYDLPDEQSAGRLLNGVLDLGINYIDTAPAYGLSEERVGRAIAHRYHECFVSTKVGEEFEAGRSRHDFSSRGVRSSVERSLRRLATDVLDLVFIHCSRDDLRIIEETDAVPTLQALRDEGLVRRIGFSGYTNAAFRACLSWADAVMVEYHMENRALEPFISDAAAGGVNVVVKKGLAAGHLPAEDAIRFVLSHGQVNSMVIGGLDLEHMRENLRVAREVRGGR